jgi:hypothetical protein
MGQAAETRLPQPGEGWRHYGGQLYQIVGNGHDTETGRAVVVYMEWGWSLAQPPNLWSRPLDSFMGFVLDAKKRRFQFDRDPA